MGAPSSRPGVSGRFNAWKGSQEPSCHPFLRGPFCGSALPTEMPSFPGLSPHTSGHHPSPFTSVLIRRGICSLGRPHVPPTGFSLLPAAPAGSPGCAQPLHDEVLGCWGDPWLGQMPSYSPGMLLLEISLPGFKHSAVTTRSLSPARPLPAGCPGGISHLPGPKQRASLSALTCCSPLLPAQSRPLHPHRLRLQCGTTLSLAPLQSPLSQGLAHRACHSSCSCPLKCDLLRGQAGVCLGVRVIAVPEQGQAPCRHSGNAGRLAG